MTMYNMIMGYSPACVIVLPMLGRKQDEYPRFRDCFITVEGDIAIYTRVGGNNRGCGYGEEALYKDENFLRTYDDDYDSTYATYVFKCPDKWKDDLDKIMGDRFKEVSDEYVELVESFYPKLKKSIRKLFRGE